LLDGKHLLRIGVGAEEVKRNIGLVPHDPAVMTRSDVKQITRLELRLLTVIHRDLAATRDYETYMLDLATARASEWPYMCGPLPAGSVRGTADSKPAKRYKLEPPLHELTGLVRGFEAFDDD
jgi:hypothetical protein